MRHFMLFLLITMFSFQLLSQGDCPCCTDQHKQFDFWIGEWEVYDTLGNKLGVNVIKKIENNCGLQENWTGMKGTTGTSYNYYNPKDESWNQLWIDNQGTILELKGQWNGNSMVLKSEGIEGKNLDIYFNRISWTMQKDGSVTQHWDILDRDDHIIGTLFHGVYRKKESQE